ncbi:MAG: response regulator transcription factor [Anaerolineales bacterium]
MSRTILVVDDDRKTVDLIRLYLEKDEYQVLVAYDGRQALETARRLRPDLMILDLMLPKIDGLDICRTLREETNLPIIILTAKTTEQDKLIGLDLGADDYITKPFSPRELMARMRSVLRRSAEEKQSGPTRIDCGDLVVDFMRRQVCLLGELIHLTPKEFRLLEILIRQPERVFSRLDLLEGAFGYDYGGLERTVDVHIMNLRKKIELNPERPRYVQTVYGIGYKFTEDAIKSKKTSDRRERIDVQ